MSSRQIDWDEETEVEEVVQETAAETVLQTKPEPEIVSEPDVAVDTTSVESKPKNGHKKQKVRDLNESEEEAIREQFLNDNGMLEYDAIKTRYRYHVADDIYTYQISGFVTSLHAAVLRGELEMPKIKSYLNYRLEKNPELSSSKHYLKFVGSKAYKDQLTDQDIDEIIESQSTPIDKDHLLISMERACDDNEQLFASGFIHEADIRKELLEAYPDYPAASIEMEDGPITALGDYELKAKINGEDIVINLHVLDIEDAPVVDIEEALTPTEIATGTSQTEIDEEDLQPNFALGFPKKGYHAKSH